MPVPDPRLQVLTDMERSKKTVAAQVRFVDVPGGVSSAQGIAKLREVDALAVVLRCFGADAAPADELETVRGELLLADLGVIDSALEKAEKKARGKPGPEVDALRRAKEALEAETPLRDAGVTDEDAAHLRGIAPLTLKPEVVIANLEEGLGGAAGARGGRAPSACTPRSRPRPRRWTPTKPARCSRSSA